MDRDHYSLNFSVLTDYAGNKITVDNALPVKVVDGGGVNKNRQFTQAIAYTGTLPEYVGMSVPGTAKSEAKWQIKKLSYNGSLTTDVQYAGGSDAFDKIWNNRADYDYS